MPRLSKEDQAILDKVEMKAAKERRIRTEKTRLRRMLSRGGIEPERLRGVDRLVSSAAFLTVTLQDLEDEINLDGCSSEYQNGENQWGTKQSPAVQSHATFMQRYLSAMKQLIDLLPDDARAPSKPGDELLEHINGR